MFSRASRSANSSLLGQQTASAGLPLRPAEIIKILRDSQTLQWSGDCSTSRGQGMGCFIISEEQTNLVKAAAHFLISDK